MTRFYWRSLGAALVLVAALLTAGQAAAASPSDHSVRTYRITVENLTGSEPFTPPVVATHQGATDVFEVGAPASAGVQGVAENGDVPGLVAQLEADRHVGTVAVGPGPVPGGGAVTFTVAASPGDRFVSLVSMLICTNDGFTGLDRVRLPNWVGQATVVAADAYDAGTEVNTEDADDLVPPCGPLTGLHDGSIGTGTSDPALAEGGVVAHHPGIAGIADLVPAVFDWTGPVAEVTVTRID